MTQCYSLTVKCPSQAHVLNAWSPAGDATLGGSVMRWGGEEIEGSRSLGLQHRPYGLKPLKP
jgi:hypothetical protein